MPYRVYDRLDREAKCQDNYSRIGFWDSLRCWDVGAHRSQEELLWDKSNDRCNSDTDQMDLRGTAMEYKIWTKMRDLALMEGVDRWSYVSVWHEELHCPPQELVIDKALREAKVVAAKAKREASEGTKGDRDGSEDLDQENEG